MTPGFWPGYDLPGPPARPPSSTARFFVCMMVSFFAIWIIVDRDTNAFPVWIGGVLLVVTWVFFVVTAVGDAIRRRTRTEPCPYCDFMARNAAEEMEHMSARHPDIIERRMIDAGFVKDGHGGWIDTLTR